MKTITGILLLILMGTAQTQVVDLVAPVDPAITVTLTPRDGPYTALLTNNADRPIVALTVLWQPEGGRQLSSGWDGGLETNKCCVVPASGQIMLTHPWLNPPPGMRTEPHHELDGASHVTINVDVVVFDDGLVLGADKSGLLDRLTGRRQAIDRILQTVRKAKVEGQDIDRALQGLMPTDMNFLAPPDWATQFMKQYVGLLLHQPDLSYGTKVKVPDRDEMLNRLEQVPQPPTFYRR
jgi:hypothetical protein